MCNFSVNAASDGPDADPLRAIERRLQAEDPRVALRLRIEVRDRVIAAIETRLVQNPDDRHQLFILEEHQKAREAMLDELRRLNFAHDPRYQNLDTFVDDYVQAIAQSPAINPAEAANGEALLELAREQQTWQDMIDKVRQRLVKRPGDPQLMRLLAEHQARLLKVTESRHVLLSGPATAQPGTSDKLVLESLSMPQTLQRAPADGPPAAAVAETVNAPAPAPAAEAAAADEPLAEAALPISPLLAGLLREREVFAGMVEKTRQRLAAKPELIHLNALIQQHEARLRELDAQIADLRQGE